jgi:hypothetical protein
MPDRQTVCVQCAFCVQTAECTLKSLRHKGLRFVCTSAFRERERKNIRRAGHLAIRTARSQAPHSPGLAVNLPAAWTWAAERVHTDENGTGVGAEKEPGRADADWARPGSQESLHGYFIQRPAKWHLRNPVF